MLSQQCFVFLCEKHYSGSLHGHEELSEESTNIHDMASHCRPTSVQAEYHLRVPDRFDYFQKYCCHVHCQATELQCCTVATKDHKLLVH